MNRERKILLNIVILVIALCMVGVTCADPMGTAFTYRGMLADANSPAEGLYDFEFEVYDDPDAGFQQGSTVDVNDLDVIDGYFTVQLDFGDDPNIFKGDAQWLKIAVRPGASSDPRDFVTLSPRQELTPTPYSIYAKTAGSLKDGISWSEVSSRPAGLDDGDDDTQLTEAQVDTYVANNGYGTVNNWADIPDVPADIADGDDDTDTQLTEAQVDTYVSNNGYLDTETDPTVLASVKDGVSWAEIASIPADIADGDDDTDTQLTEAQVDTYVSNNGYLDTETDPTVLASVKDGVSWSEVSGRPAGLDDGDDVGLTSETDPEVGIIDSNYVPKWDGSALVTGTIYDNGNVGIGTTDPNEKLEVAGNIKISGTGKGIKFPDGTVQTTAITGGGGGVPSGFMIVGETETPPTGYTYTGSFFTGVNADTWTSKADMPSPARGYLAAATVSGKIYAIGGNDGVSRLQDTDEYDPVANTWTSKADMPSPGRLGLAVAVANGKIYAIGGLGGGSLQDTDEYDPVANTWTEKADMPSPARYNSAAAAVNGKIYVIGGYGNSSYLQDTDEYDPVADAWTSKADMPSPGRLSLAAAVVNGKIYAIGGHDGGSTLRDTDEYDPAANTWASKADMPSPGRDLLAAAAINGKIYAIGGQDGGSRLQDTDEYDPVANTWTSKADMPSPGRLGLAVAVMDGKIYAIGGTEGGSSYLQDTDEYTPPTLFHLHKKD